MAVYAVDRDSRHFASFALCGALSLELKNPGLEDQYGTLE
jgi:hypothetical protein